MINLVCGDPADVTSDPDASPVLINVGDEKPPVVEEVGGAIPVLESVLDPWSDGDTLVIAAVLLAPKTNG